MSKLIRGGAGGICRIGTRLGFAGRTWTGSLPLRKSQIRVGFRIVVTEEYVVLLGRDQCRPPIPRDNRKFGDGPAVLKHWQEYTGKPWDYPYVVRDPWNFCPDLGFHVIRGPLPGKVPFISASGSPPVDGVSSCSLESGARNVLSGPSARPTL